MEQQTETPPGQVSGEELVRPLEGRMVAGVAAGLARRFKQPEWATRLLFVVLTAFGGLGIVLYLAGWVLMRSEEQAEPPAAHFFSRAGTARSWLGIGLIFVATLIIIDRITFLSSGVMWAGALLVLGVLLYLGVIPLPGEAQARPVPSPGPRPNHAQASVIAEEAAPPQASPPKPAPTPPILPPRANVPKERSILGRLTIGLMLLGVGLLAVLDVLPGVGIEPRPRHYIALATVILGGGLLVGSMWGRARWLILIGVVMIPTLLFSPVVERDWGSLRWNERVSPASFVEVPTSYDIEVGRLDIDLTELPWNGEEVSVSARAEVGRVVIWVPHDVGVNGSITVDVGYVQSGPSAEAAIGFGSNRIEINESGANGTLHLDARAGVGSVQVRSVFVSR